MNGDLSIGLRPAALDLVPGVRQAATAPAQPSPRPDAAQLQGIESEAATSAARLKALLTDPGMRVSTYHDDASGRIVLRVQSLRTGEVVEQMPSEQLQRLYAALRETLVDEHA